MRTSGTAVSAVLLLVGFAPPCLLFAKTRTDVPVLTEVAELHRLAAAEARRAYPVHLHGVITFYLPDPGVMFFEDSTGGIYVALSRPSSQVRAGDTVELEGVSGPGDFAPIVEQPRFRILGHTSFPPAQPTPLEDLLTGQDDSEWVAVRGIVHSVGIETSLPPNNKPSAPMLVLGIAAGGNSFKARIQDYSRTENYQRFVDAAVTVHGACGSLFNSKRQLVGIQLYVPSMDQIHIDVQAPSDPYALPVLPISSLMQFAPERASGHRIRVQGVVTLVKPGEYIVVQDSTGGVTALSKADIPVRIGDQVEVVGFPTAGQYAPVLTDADFLVTGRMPLPAPVDLTPQTLLTGDQDAELVRVEGRLIDQSVTAQGLVFILQAGGATFRALLAARERISPIRNGSRLRLEGVWSVETDRYHKPTAFRILLRSLKDIVVVEKPSWWTARRILAVLAILAVVVVFGALWVAILQRRVEESTEALRATLESAAEGIVVVDSSGRTVAHNHKCAGLLGIPDLALESGDGRHLLTDIARHLQSPEAFLAKARELDENAEAQSDDVLEFKDGRVFECHSEPQRIKGQSVGRVWGFRDVTPRKRAEKVQAATYRAAEAANAAANLRDLFHLTHSIVRDLMPAKNFYAALYDADAELLSFPYFMNEYESSPAPRKLGNGLAEYVLRVGKPLLASREVVEELKQKEGIEVSGEPVVDWLGVPLKKGDYAFGVLAVESDVGGARLGEEEQKILTFVAVQIAMAIDRMRAEEELKSALQMKTDFVSFATHQLRTPLAGIKWSLELAAQEEGLPEETAAFIQDGRDSAQRLIGMVNDLLDISRLESGKLKLAPRETSLAELTQGVLKDVSHQVEKQGHQLSVTGGEAMPPVLVDPQLFRQVILNMVSNAIKYTPSGGRIGICMSQENGQVRWAVEDSGIGIPKANQARLFEKFYRAENVYKLETEGTGLGLHLVKLIVEKSGGRVWCESEENKGSTFQFTLPLSGGNA